MAAHHSEFSFSSYLLLPYPGRVPLALFDTLKFWSWQEASCAWVGLKLSVCWKIS